MSKNALSQTAYAPKAPAGATASLHLVHDQYLFHWTDGIREHCKFLSPMAVRQAFIQEPVDSGWLPVGAIRWGTGSRGTWAVRYEPPSVRTLRLDVDGTKKPLRVPLPGLIFLGYDSAYYIWAVRGTKFNPKAPLYRAPLPNVSDPGIICFGANRHPSVSQGGIESAWRLFWSSPFNRHHADGKSHQSPEDITEVLIELARRRAPRYPTLDLVRIDDTVSQAIERFANR